MSKHTPIDIRAAFDVAPDDLPPLDFVLPGFLAGTVGVLVAPGGTGKSFWALEMTTALACSVAGGDVLGLAPKHHGRVVYLAGEDPEPVLVHRINAMGRHIKDSAARDAIAENLAVYPLSHIDVMTPEGYTELVEYADGARLVVLDTLSRIHTKNENDNGEMARLISTLEKVCAETKASILYLHHTNKGSAMSGNGDKQQAGRGASALVDNARWGAFLSGMTEDEAEVLVRNDDASMTPLTETRKQYVRFGISKLNYSSPVDDVWYERRDGGVLIPVEIVSPVPKTTFAKRTPAVGNGTTKGTGKGQLINIKTGKQMEGVDDGF